MSVIVIGGGIVGVTAAYTLAKKGRDVILIDKAHEGKASSAGAGIVCPWNHRIQSNDWYEIARLGAKYYPALISELEADGEKVDGYKKTGALYVSIHTEKLNEIEGTLKTRRKNAPEIGDILILNPAQARGFFPPLEKSLGAVYVSGAMRVEGKSLVDTIRRASVKSGVEIINGEARLVYEENQVIGVTVNGERKFADSVLIAAGAWAPSLLVPLGIKLQVEPERGQIVHLKMMGHDTSNWPVILPESSYYMLAFDDSRVVVGATREVGSGFDYRTTVAGISEVIAEGLSIAPRLRTGSLEEVRIGFRPTGPDALPVIGPIDSVKGLILATGLGSSGLTMGPYVGMLAAKIIQEEPVDLDLTPYNPQRAILV
ncbi:FAD-binding oxidoreductase [Sporosarcina sp. ACRSM]|uniref:NAD(P)/FAD-dependent oxidoreductase n=1 Tax=Sporosarcina sp. ACRSM TaxID=2918216 RepID=UPI001EF4B97E|nr:FAD-dependent oxidoreductase [Sporosarcina sp. ACRSM]MCG7333715.1 FAD-binding oxidoreductase [Sporosarcina sp. ACRSM]